MKEPGPIVGTPLVIISGVVGVELIHHHIAVSRAAQRYMDLRVAPLSSHRMEVAALVDLKEAINALREAERNADA
jgi:hypothetical protein